MERAVVPATIGVAASFAVLFQYWVVEKAPEILVHSLVNASQRWLWQQALSDLGVAVDWWGIWHCGAIIILYYSRVELLECCRRLLGCIHLALAAVHICLQFLCDWLVVGYKWLGISRQLPPPTDVETAERESPLTWPSMAVVPAGGPVLPPGTFVLVSRAPEWDEVLVLGFAEGGQTEPYAKPQLRMEPTGHGCQSTCWACSSGCHWWQPMDPDRPQLAWRLEM